jgi:3-hydroxybutyrate dehydrogenase
MAAFTGQHAVVTGGGRGIGRAVAAALSDAGATVTVMGRGEAALAEAVKRGHAAGYVIADVTDEQAVTAAMKRAATERGAVDILVPNAGAAESAPFAKTSTDLFRRMFELNCLGVVHATKAVVGDMVARGFGRIVVVASTAGLRGSAYITAYCAAKHAVVGVVRALAAETSQTGVTVNAVCPGYTDTEMVSDSIERITNLTGRTHEQALAGILKNSPLGRLITPEEVAATVLFLCSREASAISGAAVPIAGGDV